MSLGLLAGLQYLVVPQADAAEDMRDPFTFGSHRQAPVAGGAPTLVGVIWDVSSPMAIVGSDMVGVGDEVWGWRIIEIRTDSIVVEHAGRREIVRPGRVLPAP